MDYPEYIVKFNWDKYGNCGVIYKNIDGSRDYLAEYFIRDDGSVVRIVNPRDWKPGFSRSWEHTRYVDRLVRETRFNVIIGPDAYPIKNCLFLNKDEFVEEFFADML